MDSHIMTCPAYLEVYKQDPTRALDPRAEFDRWKLDEDSPESRAVAKDARLAKRFADLDARREVQTERWARPKDILAD
jgi:hypothetical protein